jgi:uncharacterized protein
MSLIGAWMYGDAVRAKALTIDRRLDHIWIISTPRISECGNFINIDAKSGHIYGLEMSRIKIIRLENNIKRKTMSLKQQIDNDIKKAMLAKNKEELEALRAIKSLILLAETEKGVATEITPDVENKLLMKAAKQRKESAEIFAQQGRNDLADRENQQLEIVNRYLPKQLSTEEIETGVKAVIAEVGAKGPQDMGKVMGVATKKFAGQADGKIISELVKKLLTP